MCTVKAGNKIVWSMFPYVLCIRWWACAAWITLNSLVMEVMLCTPTAQQCCKANVMSKCCYVVATMFWPNAHWGKCDTCQALISNDCRKWTVASVTVALWVLLKLMLPRVSPYGSCTDFETQLYKLQASANRTCTWCYFKFCERHWTHSSSSRETSWMHLLTHS